MPGIDRIARLREKARTDGALRAGAWALQAGARSVGRSLGEARVYNIYARNLDGLGRPTPIDTVRFIHCGGVSGASFPELPLPRNGDARLSPRRLAAGHQCVLATTERLVVGLCWFTSRPERDRRIGLSIDPGPEESYGFDLYVLPEYRKAMVGFGLVGRWLLHAQEEGRRRAFGVVAADNTPMIMLLKLGFGFKITERLVSARVLNRGFILRREMLAFSATDGAKSGGG